MLTDTAEHIGKVEASGVIVGEPDAALSQIPSNYVERSPRQVMEIYAKKFPTKTVPPLTDASEQGYLNSRPKD